MPTYNYSAFLAAAIESVLGQTYDHLELLVVDDGSTDNTAEVVSSFRDPRLRFFQLANGGVSAARNHGLERAKGEVLAFLDADDLWLPEKLSDQIAVLRAEPEVGFVATNFVRFKSDGTELSDQFSFMPRTVRIARRRSEKGMYGVLPGNALVALCAEAEMPWYPPANVVRRSVAEGITFPVGVRLGEDLHYFNRVWMRTRAALVYQVNLRVRVHESNSSQGAALTHHERTIKEFQSLLRLNLSDSQIIAVRQRIAMEWIGMGWSARKRGRYDEASAAYAEACRIGKVSSRVHLTRAIMALLATLQGSTDR